MFPDIHSIRDPLEVQLWRRLLVLDLGWLGECFSESGRLFTRQIMVTKRSAVLEQADGGTGGLAAQGNCKVGLGMDYGVQLWAALWVENCVNSNTTCLVINSACSTWWSMSCCASRPRAAQLGGSRALPAVH